MAQGSIKKENNNWYYVFGYQDPISGKRKQKKKRGFKTKKEAQAALTKALSQVNEGTYIEPSKMALNEFLDIYIENKKRTVSINTQQKYYYTIENHIRPFLGHMLIANLKPLHMSQLYTTLHEEKRSAATIQNVHKVLVNIYNQAVKLQVVPHNIVLAISTPKHKPQEMNIWTQEQVQMFLKTAEETPYELVYVLALNTGMRQGELIGLLWDDIDFEKQVIKVRHTIINGSKKIQESTKTTSSRRVIELSNTIIRLLKKHKTVQAEQRLKLGNGYQNMNLVNASLEGTPINPSNLRRNFNNLIKKVNVPKIRFHDLRHTHASLMLQLGVNVKVISERLGHASTKITLDRYSHSLPTMQKEAATIFDQFIYAGRK
ncbi:tyrosine-type recombinase/integrase [Metabacillus elymi]|uniref:Site-specific integrase n=1 Tax=Metabacillus elymi TaxID=2745198 RepID=A0ABX6S336_9BACI|nr:tyrosine-type recombinase/integrase [Metabacillus sp. KUDC1714]QNF28514.1 site-specific integrase [Metabacillus sp. KUDC1714]